jgi:hypothetical protein
MDETGINTVENRVELASGSFLPSMFVIKIKEVIHRFFLQTFLFFNQCMISY